MQLAAGRGRIHVKALISSLWPQVSLLVLRGVHSYAPRAPRAAHFVGQHPTLSELGSSGVILATTFHSSLTASTSMARLSVRASNTLLVTQSTVSTATTTFGAEALRRRLTRRPFDGHTHTHTNTHTHTHEHKSSWHRDGSTYVRMSHMISLFRLRERVCENLHTCGVLCASDPSLRCVYDCIFFPTACKLCSQHDLNAL